MMNDKFLSLLQKSETTLIFHGKKGETVILDEKQPHDTSVRLFEYLSPVDKIKIEAALDSGTETDFPLSGGKYMCALKTIWGHQIAALSHSFDGPEIHYDKIYDSLSRLSDLEFDSGDDGGLCYAADVLSKIASDLGAIYTDLEFELANVGRGSELLHMSLSNIIRLSMLCADLSDAVSTDRLMEIKLSSSSESLEIEFSTAAKNSERTAAVAKEYFSLAAFIAEIENGKFSATMEGGRLKMSFTFLALPEELPDFKFRDQFARYREYMEKAGREISCLRAKQ